MRKRTGQILNLPNQLTMLRLGLSALFVISLSFPWAFATTGALVIFVVASLTDWFDGYLARRLGLITDLGKLLDPLADKILVSSAFIALVARDIAPMWMVVAIIAREFLITGLRIVAAKKQLILAAEKIGKHKTVSQMLAILASLALLSLGEFGYAGSEWAAYLEAALPFLYWLAVLITVVSGVVYFYKNRFLFDEDEATAPEDAAAPAPALAPAAAEAATPEATAFPAFKEWEGITEALGQGAQIIILRKGGIHEGRGGFQPEHAKFWLFPTAYHEQADKTKPAASLYRAAPLPKLPPSGSQPKAPPISISYFAEVVDGRYLKDWETVAQLDPFHLWTEATVRERFEWSKETGLTLLVVRVFRLRHPLLIEDSPAYGGCKSWIHIPADLTSLPAEPVLTTEEFNARRGRIQSIIEHPKAVSIPSCPES